MKKRIISLLLAVAAVMSMIVVPVGAYDKHSRGALAYKAVAEELKRKL